MSPGSGRRVWRSHDGLGLDFLKRQFFVKPTGVTATRTRNVLDLFTWSSSTKYVRNAAGVIAASGANAPAFDHTIAGSPLGILIEKASTNLVLQSGDFSSASWAKVTGGAGVLPAITHNDAVAPDGAVAADRIDLSIPAGSANTTDFSRVAQGPATAAGQAYTGSLWIKAATLADVGKVILFRHAGWSSYLAHVLTADWQRVSTTETAAGSTADMQIGLRGGFGLPGGQSAVSAHVWGAQLELGSIPTSYIPTTTAAVTRNGDVIRRVLGAELDKSNLILAAEFSIDRASGSDGSFQQAIASIVDAAITGSDWAILYTTTLARASFRKNGATENFGQSGTLTHNGAISKQAIGFTNLATFGAVNGTTFLIDDTGTAPSAPLTNLATLQLGEFLTGASNPAGRRIHLRALSLYPQTPDQARLNALTV
ncbi:MAG TPA: hypothetical protein DCL54_18210 [Alphaproteobacteria bacterium]|nr:hypothetical protein [Alphaproteobacteria bacterium]